MDYSVRTLENIIEGKDRRIEILEETVEILKEVITKKDETIELLNKVIENREKSIKDKDERYDKLDEKYMIARSILGHISCEAKEFLDGKSKKYI